jgi:UDP-N-acetylmuramoyl-tripeptide--D-alanyl-D-alanine ligase
MNQMKNMTIENITKAVRGTYIGPEELLNREISAVVTDSRKTEEGCLFAAIRGERVDGHKFIPQVINRGALVVLAEQSPEKTEELYGKPDDGCRVPTILVESVLQALKDAAEFYRAQMPIPVVGIIGSVGKTSTKEMVASVLSVRYRVLKTEGNFNNELGVPMTVFRMRDEHQIAVIEMGINHFGEMHRLAKIVRPDTVIMTNIGTAHLEFLKTRDGILKAKSEVFDYFKKDGHIILNGDDDKLSTIEEKNGVAPLRFGYHRQGYSHENDFYAENVERHGLDGISCRIHMPGAYTDVMIPAPGEHMIMNALAGAAAGYVYGLTTEEIRRGIENYESLSGRFHIIHSGDVTIIDDCYNANPASMKASLSILAEADGRKVAVLGDMGELGDREKELHGEIGAFAAECGIDALYCVGPLMQNAADTANGRISDVRHFDSLEKLMNKLNEMIRPGDTVLVKASHFMNFSRIVSALSEK